MLLLLLFFLLPLQSLLCSHAHPPPKKKTRNKNKNQNDIFIIQIHCKSVRNLRPPHAPVIAILPASFIQSLLCSHDPSPPPPQNKKQKPKPKMRNDIFVLTDTQTE